MTPEWQAHFLDDVCVRPEARERLYAGEPLQASDVIDPLPTRRRFSTISGNLVSFYLLQDMPDPVAVALWNGLDASRWMAEQEGLLVPFFARHGQAAVPGLLAFAQRRPVQALRAGRWLDSAELAALALKVRRGMKVARQPATDWLLTNPDTGAHVLLRQLFGADESAREDARAALHVLAAGGLQEALNQAARELGAAEQAGLTAALNEDPLLRLPARMPKLPTFFEPAKLHRPRLMGHGTALSDEAMGHLVLMLAICRPDQPYAGLDAVRAACTPASLAEFVWGLFEQWWAAGAPSKDAWALPALGLLGDDSTAHRLGPRAMRLAKEGAKARAVAMVDLLSAFGSDAALMHLSNLAERCKATQVRSRAAAQVDAVAQQRGLTRIELADRLVPTLGLEASRTLDFGPRQFSIGLDEALTPFVKDMNGARLKDLPKPRQSDDAAMAQAAALRFKQLKTELKGLAKVQLARLEQAMVVQRRWSLEDFQAFFVEHPLTRELAARLLWAVSDGSLQPVGFCRIAEDGTLADAHDKLFEPPPASQFAIVHPLRLPEAHRDAFLLQFADYEILQPFPQLNRETFALEPDEAQGSLIERVNGRDVATGAIIGLLDSGWLRGGDTDGGMVSRLDKPMDSAGLKAVLELDPGMPIMRLSEYPRQTLGRVFLQDAQGQTGSFSAVDPILCSELLRDLNRLAPFKAAA
ncbi:MAG: hypothetical protein RLZZ618_3816 [Pseudomonadota bacterium]